MNRVIGFGAEDFKPLAVARLNDCYVVAGEDERRPGPENLPPGPLQARNAQRPFVGYDGTGDVEHGLFSRAKPRIANQVYLLHRQHACGQKRGETCCSGHHLVVRHVAHEKGGRAVRLDANDGQISRVGHARRNCQPQHHRFHRLDGGAKDHGFPNPFYVVREQRHVGQAGVDLGIRRQCAWRHDERAARGQGKDVGGSSRRGDRWRDRRRRGWLRRRLDSATAAGKYDCGNQAQRKPGVPKLRAVNCGSCVHGFRPTWVLAIGVPWLWSEVQDRAQRGGRGVVQCYLPAASPHLTIWPVMQPRSATQVMPSAMMRTAPVVLRTQA